MIDVQDMFSRAWENLMARPSGPLAFRFIIQPTMAAILAIRDGVKDAQSSRSPYFWTVLMNPEERAERLREGVTATTKIIVLALLLDAIYQIKVLGTFYAGEAVFVALLLAFIPYLLIRGPVARVAHWWSSPPSREERESGP
jgi:hypothetical protein